MADDDDGRGADRVFFFDAEEPAARRAHAEHGEVVPRDKPPARMFGFLAAHRAVDGDVEAPGAPDGDELLGMRQVELPKEHRVDQREDGGVRADAERERADDDSGEAGVPAQRAQGVAQVLAELVEDVGSAAHRGMESGARKVRMVGHLPSGGSCSVATRARRLSGSKPVRGQR